MSTLDHTLEPRPDSNRRLEVITGTGRRRQVIPAAETAPAFVPAVINEPGRKGVGKATKREGRRRGHQTNGIIEVGIDGVTIWVGGGADARTVAAVIRALKAVT